MRYPWLLLLLGCSGMPTASAPDLDRIRDAEWTRAAADPFLIAALDRPELAQRAATAIGRIQSKSYLPALIKALEPRHPAGTAAIWAAGQLAFDFEWRPADSAPVVEVLARRAADRDATVRLRIAEALGKLGGERVPALLGGLLKDGSVDVRVAAVDAFWRMQQTQGQKPDVAPLLPLARDPEEDVRWHVAYALWRLKEGKDQLRALAKDSNRWARLFAIRGLGEGGGEDPEFLVRVEAGHKARETARTAQQAGVKPEDLRSAKHRSRLDAIEAFGSRQDDATLELLKPLVSDGDVAIEWMAIEALGQRKQGADVLAARAKGTVNLAFEPLIASLAACGASDALEELAKRGLPDYSASARRACWKLTGKELPVVPAPRPAPWKPEKVLTGRHVLEIKHEKGTMKLLLDADSAPINVSNVVALAKRGYYDGLEWHRLVPNFVIQGGDPRNDGFGDPGYRVIDEISTLPHARGAVGISKMIRDTGDSQLYVTHIPTPHLDGRYTVIGYVIEGLDVLDRIERGDRIVTVRVID